MKKELTTCGEIELSKKVLAAISDMGFEEPSPIQSKTIPLVLAGNDVIGQAQTGTGKTAAFGIPAIEKVDDHNKHIQALILTPTRELAIQISEEITKIGKFKKVKSLPIYGGQSIDRQIKALKSGVQVVIGTPGRLLDHIRRRTIKLDQVKMLILDEATSSIDTRTESIVQRGMDNLMKGRTVFVIAHRLSTIRNSDAIIVLEHGKIIERGDHEDLIKNKGTYYQLYTGKLELS